MIEICSLKMPKYAIIGVKKFVSNFKIIQTVIDIIFFKFIQHIIYFYFLFIPKFIFILNQI